MKKIFAIVSVMALGACSQNWDIDGVSNMKAEGTNFDKNLKNEYVELAIAERYYGDWDSVDNLLTKAISAGEGTVVALPSPSTDEIKSQEGIKALKEYRSRLQIEYSKGARDKSPIAAAQAQVSYECMINGWKWNAMDDIAYCGKLFEKSMAEIQEKSKADNSDSKTVKAYALGEKADKAFSANDKKPEMVSKPKIITPVVAKKSKFSEEQRKVYMEDGKSYMTKNGQHIIYYAFNSSKPAQNIDTFLKDIVLEDKIQNPEKIEVGGYTDTAGSKKINKALSLRRAKTVADALVKYGVDQEKVEAKGYGETNLAVPTADDVAEPKNRRTIIEFK